MRAPYRFIIADDDLSLAKLLEVYLTQAYPLAQMTRVFNGGAALALYELQGADLLILDISMPLLTGLEVTQKLRSRSDTVPIVLISAASTVPYALDRDPHTAFCAKPFELETLVGTIQGLFRHYQT